VRTEWRVIKVPSISMFFGLIIYMYFYDNGKHHLPHIHVKYEGAESVVSIPDGELFEGNLPLKKLNLVRAWITIHEEELIANWQLVINGETPYKIEPLR